MRAPVGALGASLLLLLAAAAAAAAPAAASARRPPDDADIVIVGGGTAGCALAARLCAALPARRVVLLERGGRRNATEEFLVRSPRQAVAAWAVPSLLETFPSAPERALGGRRVQLATGATLGGGSAVNIGQWSVPLAGTVDGWGIPGLGDTAARRYFRRAARQLRVAVPRGGLRQAYVDDWLAAAARAGVPPVDDTVWPPPDRGSWVHRLTVDRAGRRRDACTAYVAPALKGACAANLRVHQGVTVTKVLWEDDDGARAAGPTTAADGRRRRRGTRVAGVAYVASADGDAGRVRTLRARQAVISAAGAVGSPKLLQLSGIGRRRALRRAGVTPRVDLPVGERFQTRPFLGVVSEYAGVPLAAGNNASVVAAPATRRRWEAGRGGVLGVAAHAGLLRVPDGAGGYVTASFTPDAVPGEPVFGAYCMTNPSSTGRLTLADASPFSAPVVETRSLGEGHEVATLLACLRRMAAVAAAFPPAFRMRQTVPRRGRLDEAYVRASSEVSGHLVGGCQVGAVVDGGFRVKGFRNLYVVDSSAIPSIPLSAGTMASVYMLAEFAAEKLIRVFRAAAI